MIPCKQAVRTVDCPHWWHLRDRSTLLDALLELHAASACTRSTRPPNAKWNHDLPTY